MSSDEIDSLLERYLLLLDQYTALRKQLGDLQSSVHQNLSRANFTSDRGIRYGQDYYDDRMQATRKISIGIKETVKYTTKGEPVPEFKISLITQAVESESGNKSRGGQKSEVNDDENVDGKNTGAKKGEADMDSEIPSPESKSAKSFMSKTESHETKHATQDPLRMFGILTPRALRAAKSDSIQLVEDIIPKAASIDAELKELEIQIRRARKHRAKAEMKAKVGRESERVVSEVAV